MRILTLGFAVISLKKKIATLLLFSITLLKIFVETQKKKFSKRILIIYFPLKTWTLLIEKGKCLFGKDVSC